MKSANLLRCALACEWIFIIATIAIDSATESSLPEPLYLWIQSQSSAELTAGSVLLGGFYLTLLASILTATVGLFLLKRWAAWLYLITSFLGISSLLFMGPNIQSAPVNALDEIASVLSGMVVAVAFFTDSLSPKKRETPPPLPAQATQAATNS